MTHPGFVPPHGQPPGAYPQQPGAYAQPGGYVPGYGAGSAYGPGPRGAGGKSGGGAGKVLKIVGIVLGALVLSCTVCIVVNKDEIDAHAQKREKIAEDGVATIAARAEGLLVKTQALFPLQEEKACPEAMRAAEIEFLPTSLRQLAHFAPEVPLSSTPITDGTRVSTKLEELTPKARADASKFDVADAVEDVLAHDYVGIFVAEAGQEPKIVDSTSFESGFFSGWVIVAELETQEPLCWGHFTAMSSSSVSGGASIGLARGLIQVPVGGGEDDLVEDYAANFTRAAADTVDRIRRGTTTPIVDIVP
jgi:hypothetical protein